MVDDEFRSILHERLDEILDKRSAMEADQPLSKTLGQLLAYHERIVSNGVRARPLLYEAAELARDLIGDDLRDAALWSTSTEQRLPRETLRTWLSLVLPLLKVRPNFGTLQKQLTIYDVLDGLSALDAGEIQPLFKANTGKNRRANRWSMARAKLEALTWKKRLLVMGLHEKEASYRVTVAFGEQWETIRKWKSQCEEILGESLVTWELEFAGGKTDPFVYPPPARTGMFANSRINPEEALAASGARYKRERTRAAELSKRKSRGTNNASLHPEQKPAFNSGETDGQ